MFIVTACAACVTDDARFAGMSGKLVSCLKCSLVSRHIEASVVYDGIKSRMSVRRMYKKVGVRE